MVRRHTSALRASLMAADFLVAAVLFIIVSVCRSGRSGTPMVRLGIDPCSRRSRPMARAGHCSCPSRACIGFARVTRSVREALALVRAGAILGVAMVIYLFLQRVSNASRLLMAVCLWPPSPLTFLARAALRSTLPRCAAAALDRLRPGCGAPGQRPSSLPTARAHRRAGPARDRLPERVTERRGPRQGPVLGRSTRSNRCSIATSSTRSQSACRLADWNLVEPITHCARAKAR